MVYGAKDPITCTSSQIPRDPTLEVVGACMWGSNPLRELSLVGQAPTSMLKAYLITSTSVMTEGVYVQTDNKGVDVKVEESQDT